jgi:TonB family protein
MFRPRNTVWIAILTIITALLVGSCAKDVPRVDTAEGLKKALSAPDPGSILVLSVPGKLKVYFGENTDKKEPEKSGWVPMKKSDSLIELKNLMGETPLLLQDIKPGNYLLGIAPIIALHPDFKRGDIDNTLTVNSVVVFGGVPTGYPPPKEASKGAAIYSVTKKENTPLRVIVLAYSQDAGLEELKPLYPADDVFQFDEQGFLADLKKKTAGIFSETQANDIVSLLRRGGKIVVTFGDIKIMSEIKVDQAWELKTLARIIRVKKPPAAGDDSSKPLVKDIDEGGVEGGVVGGVLGLPPSGSPSGKPQDSRTPIRIASGKTPRLIKKVEPKYPELAKVARIQGKVILDIAVDIHGKVIPGSIKVLRGQPLLNQAGVDAVKQWVYEPYIQEGVPKSARFTVVVDFNLK